MAATVERISDRTRGTGYKVALPEVGDRFTVRILPEYGNPIAWHLGQVQWLRSAGAAVETNSGIFPFEEAEWDSRAEYPSHAERYIITGWRVTATAPRQSALLWTTVSVDESGFSTDPAP